jgi:hypothetical protein
MTTASDPAVGLLHRQRREVGEHDDGERPERELPHHLTGAERQTEEQRRANVEPPPDENPCSKEQAEGRDEEVGGLRVEHRSRAGQDRRERDEPGGHRREPPQLRPQKPRERRDEQHGPDHRGHVEQLAELVRIAEPELTAHPRDRPGDAVVERR